MPGLWVPHPSELVLLHDSGQGDMGDVTDIDSAARFWLDVEKCYTLVWIRGGFLESSGSATLSIKVDNSLAIPDVDEYEDGGQPTGSPKLATPFDFVLDSLASVGIGGDNTSVNYRIMPDEYPHWTFFRNPETHAIDKLVLEWTNPGTQFWALQVALWDTSKVPGIGV